jgi:hypothetical protein
VDLGQQRPHVLRLDDEQQGVGQGGRLGVVEHPHAVLVGELGRAVGPALGDDQPVNRVP